VDNTFQDSINPSIKKRNIVVIYLLMFVTLGIYALVWSVKTKEEINSLGGSIPTAWLIIVPIANIYWAWRYCEDFGKFVKKDDNGVMWFLIYVLAGIIMPAIVQSELNKIADQYNSGINIQ
jgi:hypothetical protein